MSQNAAFLNRLRLRSVCICVLKRGVLRRVFLGRRLPKLNGKPQERLRFRALRSKTLAFKKKRIAIIFQGRGLRLGPLHSKNAAFRVCVLKPTKFAGYSEKIASVRNQEKRVLAKGVSVVQCHAQGTKSTPGYWA